MTKTHSYIPKGATPLSTQTKLPFIDHYELFFPASLGGPLSLGFPYPFTFRPQLY